MYAHIAIKYLHTTIWTIALPHDALSVYVSRTATPLIALTVTKHLYDLEEEHPKENASCANTAATCSGIAATFVAPNATNVAQDILNGNAHTRPHSTTMSLVTPTSEMTETGTCQENVEEVRKYRNFQRP
jgi:hypothetical protein